MTEKWTPNQHRVIHDLLEWDDELRPLRAPVPPGGLREDLIHELEKLTARTATAFAQNDQRLTVNKFDLTSVHKCEGLYVAPDEFEWTVANARGKVVHRAIQKSLSGRFKEMPPLELAQETVEALEASSDDRSFAEFLANLDPATLAELLSETSAMLTAFFSDWPPIRPWMQPRVEPAMHAKLHGGRIMLKGRFDLALGPPGRGPVVITDLKTGIDYPEHREELRYYALLETLKTGVPPIRVASYYLDGSWFQPEDVNKDVLRSAVRRTGDAINIIGELWWRQREPQLSPGWHCRYCPSQPDCLTGQDWLTQNQGQSRLGLAKEK
jgi:hypothetical protein